MQAETFMKLVEEGHKRGVDILLKKAPEYSRPNRNRLEQFYEESDELCPPTRNLIDMAKKHWTSIKMMADNPTLYSLNTWRQKLDDLRNYTHLMDGLLVDMGVE